MTNPRDLTSKNTADQETTELLFLNHLNEHKTALEELNYKILLSANLTSDAGPYFKKFIKNDKVVWCKDLNIIFACKLERK